MYKCYDQYMKYAVSEFRKNLRQMFNSAANGVEVVIERYGEKFSLSKLDDEPVQNIKENNDGTISPVDPTKPSKFETRPPKRNVGVNLCPKHEIPLTAAGKCLQKGCKYA